MGNKITQFLSALALLLSAAGGAYAQTPMYTYQNNATGGNAIPLGTGTSWDNYRSQFLYLPGDFTPTINTTAVVTNVYFRVSGTSAQTTYSNFIVTLGNTTQTALTATYVTGLSLGLNATTQTFTAMTGNQWMKIELATPVTINFAQPLVIDVSQTGKVGGAGGITLLAGGTPVDPQYTGNTQTYGANPSSTTGTARRYSYQVGVDVITCSTAVTSNPVAKTLCEKQATSFSAAAQDVASFRWQVDEGNGFIDVINNAIYSGASASTLNLTGTPANYNGFVYRCIAAKSSCKDTTNDALLTVHGLVNADALPDNDTTCINATKDLAVKASGTILSYQWQMFITGVGFIDVPQAPPYIHMGNKLQIAGVPDTLDGTRFRCLVNGKCDTVTSNETALAVDLIPSVAVPPADVTADPGDAVTFEVQATGANVKYEWQVAAPDAFVIVNDGGIYSGAKTNRLTVRGVSRVQNEFKFRCVVRTTAACNAPGDTSNFGVLYVNPAASVSMLSKEGEMILYPNPVNGSSIYIQANGKLAGEALKYTVVDKAGRVLSAGNLNRNDKTEIDIANLAADIYLVQIMDANNVHVATARFTKL